RGQHQAEKVRPCIVAEKFPLDASENLIALLPITSTPINDWNVRSLIPSEERKRVGMDPTRAQSINISDVNLEVVEESPRICAKIGHWTFSKEYLDEVRRRFKTLHRKSQLSVSDGGPALLHTVDRKKLDEMEPELAPASL